MGKKSRRRNGRPRESTKSGLTNKGKPDPKNIKHFQMNISVPHGVDPETFVREKLAAANIDPDRLLDLELDPISPEDANKENNVHHEPNFGVGKGHNNTPREASRSSKIKADSNMRSVEMNNVLGRNRGNSRDTPGTTRAKANSNMRNAEINVPVPAGVHPETYIRGKYPNMKEVRVDVEVPPGIDPEAYMKQGLAAARADRSVLSMKVEKIETKVLELYGKTSLPPREFIAKVTAQFKAGGFPDHIKDMKLEAVSGQPGIIKFRIEVEASRSQPFDEERIRAALSAPTQVKPKMTLQDMTSQLQDLGIQADSPHSVDEDRPRQITPNSNVVKIVEIEDSEIEELMQKKFSIKAASSCTDGPRQTKKGVKGAISNDLQRRYLQEIAEKVELGLPGVHAVLIPRAGDGVGRGRPYCVDEISPWMDYCANCYSGVVAYDDADSFCISTPRFDCANCHKVWYCNSKCQSEHWKWHKKRCKSSTGTKEERKEWKRQARQWEEENAEMLQVEKYKMKYHEEMMKVENKVYVKPKKMS